MDHSPATAHNYEGIALGPAIRESEECESIGPHVAIARVVAEDAELFSYLRLHAATIHQARQGIPPGKGVL